MSKPHEKRDAVAAFICAELERFYMEKTARRRARKRAPCFKNKAQLIEYVLSSPLFIETKQFYNLTAQDRDSLDPKVVVVSANTVRETINGLLDEAIIEEKDGEIVWRPKPSFSEKHFPILQIAPQIEVTMNVPACTFFLTVPESYSIAISDYLSSQFYKDDILFIPMGRFIMCVGVLPGSMVDSKRHKVDTDDKEMPYEQWARYRVETALEKFKGRYPSFSYKYPYEMAYASYEDNSMREELRSIVKDRASKQTVEDILDPRSVGERFSSLQQGLAFFNDLLEKHENAGQPVNNNENEDVSNEKDGDQWV